MMKTNYLLLLGLLFFACHSPEKLYQKGAVDEAYSKLLVNSKKKLSLSEKSLLTKIHADKVEGDIKIINEWSAQDVPEIWPRIKGRLDRIAVEQNAVLKISDAQNISLDEIKMFPNLEEKIGEASVKAAAYYYDRQQKEYALAITGDKKAARRGFALGEKVMEYELDYKDASTTNAELREIGMDYVLVYFEGAKDFPPTAYSLRHFNGGWSTPEVNNWSTVSFDESEISRVDYWLRLTMEEARVGPPQWSSSSCTNTKSIEVGTEIIDEWSERDSAYVKKSVPVFQDVTVTVTNYIQFRNADLPFTAELIPNGSKKPIAGENFGIVEEWTNTYGETSGDDRAIDTACCPDSGFVGVAPSDESMLRELGIKSRVVTRQFLAKNLESYTLSGRRGR